MRLRATIEYEVNPSDYVDKDVPMILAAEEAEILENELFDLDSEIKVKVEEIKE